MWKHELDALTDLTHLKSLGGEITNGLRSSQAFNNRARAISATTENIDHLDLFAAMTSGAADRLPVADPVTSFWNEDKQPMDDHRTTSDLPSHADIVIIGSGFAGVATAYHILKDHPQPPSIVLLEARKACSGATGRNGGHVKPDPYFNVTRYIKMYGEEAAAELAAFETANVYAVKELVETESIECDFHLTRAIDVFLNSEHATQTVAAYRQLVQAGLTDLWDVAYIPKSDVERVCK